MRRPARNSEWSSPPTGEDAPKQSGFVLGGVGCAALLAVACIVAYMSSAPSKPTPQFSESVARTHSQTALTGLREKADVKLIKATHLSRKPQGDVREYQYARLDNGIEVVNVHDARAMQKAYAVAVHAGSFNDPKEFPGLAHFCEHMLFLGTEKYPEAEGFDNFMSAHGGSNNAYTADEVTVYYAEVAGTAGDETLDRLADFFRAPLFNSSFVKKEVHAIDSEHAKNVQDPTRRVLGVMYALANKESPLSQFHTGNDETLIGHGKDPVTALKAYFKDHYCPSRMRLVTFGADPLEKQLESSVQHFSHIPAGSENCQKAWSGHVQPGAWPKDKLGTWVSIQGTLPQAQLWMMFPMPDTSPFYHSQPLEYVRYTIEYGGVDSLARVLQDNLGLAESIGTFADTSSVGTNFFVVVELTPEARTKEAVSLVMDMVFAYIAKMRHNGVDKKLYTSLKDVIKLQWDWAEPSGPSSTAMDLAERMTRLPSGALLTGDTLIDAINSTRVMQLLNMIRPDNMNVGLVIPAEYRSNVSLFRLGANKAELPHYGVAYSKTTLAQVFPSATARWNTWLSGNMTVNQTAKYLKTSVAKQQSLGLKAMGTTEPVCPHAIANVPKEISLENMKVQTSSDLFGPRPTKVSAEQSTALLRGATQTEKLAPEVWYRSGWVTKSPKVQTQMALRPLRKQGAPETSARDFVRLSLHTSMLGEEVVPKMVDLSQTGVSYSIDASVGGLSFTFSGFAPLMQTLVNKVVDEFNEFNTKKTMPESWHARFGRTKKQFQEDLETYSDMPVSYAIADRNLLLTRGAHSRRELLDVVGNVSMESAITAATDILLSHPLKLTSLTMGNIQADQAKKMVSSVVSNLKKPKAAPGADQTEGEVELVAPVVRVARPVEVRKKNPRKGDDNDVVVVSLMAGVSTIEHRVIYGLLGQILAPVAYNELRTNRQLGYVVHAGSAQLSNVQYFSCVVQGHVLDADSMEGAVEAVLTNYMPKKLEELTDEDFDSYKSSFRQDLQTPPIAFTDEVSNFWGPISKGGRCFDLRDAMLSFLNTSSVTKSALIKAWNELAMPTDGVRRKLTIKYFADEVPARKDADATMKIWEEQGIAEDHASLFRREHGKTLLLESADSAARHKILAEGKKFEGGNGYYPNNLNCKPARDNAAKTNGNAHMVLAPN